MLANTCLCVAVIPDDRYRAMRPPLTEQQVNLELSGLAGVSVVSEMDASALENERIAYHAR